MDREQNPQEKITAKRDRQKVLVDFAPFCWTRFYPHLALRVLLSHWERIEVRALRRAFNQRCDRHHQECADQCREHVVLRIPFITLTAEPVYTLPGRNHFGDDALDNFKKSADRNDDSRREPKTPAPPNSAEAQKQFAHRKDKEKSKSAVSESVVMIARKIEMFFCPKAERHACVRVMRTDHVKDEK